MPLPKIKYPLYELEVPSTKEKALFRQMLVSDEKILLMAKTSEDEHDIFRAVKQVVNNCLQDIDVDTLTTFDLEYIFLKLRAGSIGSIVELTFHDKEDDSDYSFAIDLDEVEMKYPENATGAIVQIGDDTSIKLRYPPATLFDQEEAMSDNKDSYEWIASKCIDTIFVDDEVYEPKDSTDEELLEYILSLDTKSYQQIKDFISSMPRLNYIIEYTNKKGTERKFVLNTLTDFFTLR